MPMAGKLIASIALSALLSSLAWIIIQLNHLLGVLLFISALIIPPAIFRPYYRKRFRLVSFSIISLILMLLLMPPPVTGPNVEFGLYFATGCWGRKADTWPLGGGELTYSCNKTVAYSTILVSGVAWKSSRVRLPVLGRYVTLHEPREKADMAYREAVKRVESKGYHLVVENYANDPDIIGDSLFVKGNECVYLAEMRILGGGLAVISARGPCRGVKGFALRWHSNYLWNASEPPIFEKRFNWSSNGSVRVGKLNLSDWPGEWVGNTYKAIEIELKGTGYVKLMGKSGDCRWSLWVKGRESVYVALNGKEILVLRGKTEEVENSAEKLSPYCLRNGRNVAIKTPEEALNTMTVELNESLALKPLREPGVWALAGREFSIRERNATVLILVYGIPEQCNHARYLLDTGENTTSVCLKRGGYFVVVAVKGGIDDVSFVLSSIQRPKNT